MVDLSTGDNLTELTLHFAPTQMNLEQTGNNLLVLDVAPSVPRGPLEVELWRRIGNADDLTPVQLVFDLNGESGELILSQSELPLTIFVQGIASTKEQGVRLSLRLLEDPIGRARVVHEDVVTIHVQGDLVLSPLLLPLFGVAQGRTAQLTLKLEDLEANNPKTLAGCVAGDNYIPSHAEQCGPEGRAAS